MNGEFELATPVALFAYRRPEYTAEVFQRIADAEPPRLILIADGPANRAERERTEAVREVLADVTWECDVERVYADENLGIRRRFVTGMEYVFDAADRAIILEDDTVPDPTFFRFCQELLDRYENDERIMTITGRNQLGEWRADRQDYHFSHYGGIWGWATWSDAWAVYDPGMELWADPEVRNRIRDLLGDRWQYNHMERVFQDTYDGHEVTWDYQWTFARLINSGLSVVPSQNLVANVGFGEAATHTTSEDSPFAGTSVYSADFPLNSPTHTVADGDYDRAFHELRPGRWKEHPLVYSAWKRLKRVIPGLR